MTINDVRTALQAVVLVVMLLGLFSLFVPGLPGMVIIWAPTLVYGLVTGFNWVSGILFAIITLLMLLGSVIDNFIMGKRAHQYGASWLAIILSMIAGVGGTLIFPPFGGLIAVLLTLFLVEMIRLRDLRKAIRSTKEMALGCGWAAIVRFGLGVVMILLWLAWAAWVPA